MGKATRARSGPPFIRVILSSAGPVLVIMVPARRTTGPRPSGVAACRGCRLHEVHLGVIWLVVNELIAGGAVPADLDGSAAGEVTRGVGLVGVPAPPVGEQAERPGEFGALCGG